LRVAARVGLTHRHPEEPVATYQVDPDTGIPDLIRSLADDSKRLAGDEVRLAKLELHDNVRSGIDGVIRLALAGAFAVVAAVALTVVLVAAVSAMLGHHYWAGALIVGAGEVLIGVLFLRRGASAIKSRSYSLQVARESLKDTAIWVRHPTRR
jgi:Putative Actinobacterial Holin-X, holin superfamily III